MRQAALCNQPLTAHEVFLMGKTTIVMFDKDGKPITPKKSASKAESKKSDENE